VKKNKKTSDDFEKKLQACKKELEETRKKLNLFNALLEHVPEQIYFKDKESRFVMASKSVVEQFGVKDISELIGKTDFDYFTEEHARPAFEDEQKIIKTGKPLLDKVEKETHPDGKVTWVSTTKVPRYDEKGKIIGILGVSKDVTRRKELEEKLESRLKRLGKEVLLKSNLLNALLDFVPDRIYFKDRESRFLDVSKSKAEGTGLTREQFKGKTDFDFFPEKEAKEMFEDEQRIMETGESVVDKVHRIELSDGTEKWLSATKIPFFDARGDIIGTFGISRDVTELKTRELEKEEKIAAQREELVELSTPVIDVWEGVLTVPVLGVLDSERAARLSESLLTQILEKRATAAIIDISGIIAVDSAVADLLIRTARAVSLVGAEAILTGVGVEIAQTIADLGIDMKDLKTMSTLRDGLKYAIGKERKMKKISPGNQIF
jgi:PAS domain S-box-containing protein